MTAASTPMDLEPLAALTYVSLGQLETRKKLRAVPLFAPLSDATIGIIAGVVDKVMFAAGVPIIKRGDQGDTLYIIDSGTVVCTDLDGGAKELKLHAGSLFGERALLSNEPRAATAKYDAAHSPNCAALGAPPLESTKAPAAWK